MPINNILQNRPQWYLVSAIFLYNNDSLTPPFKAEEGVYQIKAENAIEAFRRATKLFTDFVAPDKQWPDKSIQFLGITELMPVWEEFEDGSELGYRDLVVESAASLNDYILAEDEIHGLLTRNINKLEVIISRNDGQPTRPDNPTE